MSTTFYPVTDAELIALFGNMNCGMKYKYEVIFQDKYSREHLAVKVVQADNKVEATKFAREYGVRFQNANVVSVSRLEA